MASQLPAAIQKPESFWSKLFSSVFTQDMIILGIVCFISYILASQIPIDQIAEKIYLPIINTPFGDTVARAVLSAVGVVLVKAFVL